MKNLKIRTKLSILALFNFVSLLVFSIRVLSNVSQLEHASKIKIEIIILLIIITCLQLGVSALIYKSIKTPLKTFQKLMAKLALGDLTENYPLDSVSCSEIMGCGKNACPDYGKNDVLCWFDVGSYAPEFGADVHCPKILGGE